MHFDSMIYQQIVEIPMGTNGAQLIYIYFSKYIRLHE